MKQIENLLLNIILFIGILEIIIGIVVNPKIKIIFYLISSNKSDVLYIFSNTIFILGLMTIASSIYFFKKKKHINFIFLILSLSLIVIADRLLLVKFGLPLWKHDSELHYVHRPNKQTFWSNRKKIIINELGFHDDNINIKKRKNEYRALNIGDSIVMGHEVEKKETFSYLMRNKIIHDSSGLVINTINMGVQGYSTFQYLKVLERNLFLNPDHIIISICLNDFTEQYKVNKKYGGIGFDYHEVEQISSDILAYVYNDTGFGRLAQKIKFRNRLHNMNRENELNEVRDLLAGIDTPNYNHVWSNFYNDIIKIKDICIKNNIKLTVVIFPYTFQINDYNSQNIQRKIIAKLDNLKIQSIDILSEIEPITNSDETINKSLINNYYIDENHLSPLGHKLVAEILYDKIFN